MLVHQRLLIIAILFISIIAFTSLESNAVQSLQIVDEKWYSFSIPADWSKLTPDFKNSLLKSIESQSKVTFKDYYGDYSETLPERIVHNFIGFFSPGQKILFSAFTMNIPKNMKNYPEIIYQHSKEVIEWGKRNGRVKDVLQNETQTINGLSIHHSDLIMGSGQRMIGLAYYHPNTLGMIVTVNIMANAPTLTDKQNNQIEDAIKSFKPKIQ